MIMNFLGIQHFIQTTIHTKQSVAGFSIIPIINKLMQTYNISLI